jgi:hypothetical protein
VKKRVFKTLLSFLFLVTFTLLLPQQALADNNSLDVPTCEITVNGTSVPYTQTGSEPDISAVPLVYPARVTVKGATTQAWSDVTVRLSDTALEEMNNCAGDETIEVLQLAANTGFLNTYEKFRLDRDSEGVYSGGIRASGVTYDPPNVDQGFIIGMDVEIPSNGAARCQAELPICRRAYVRFETDVEQDEGEACLNAITALTNEFDTAIPASAQPGSIPINLPSYGDFQTKCPGAYIIKIEATSDATGLTADELNNPGVPLALNINAYGQYRVVVDMSSLSLYGYTDFDDAEDLVATICISEDGTVSGNCDEVTEATPTPVPYNVCAQLKEGSPERQACCDCAGFGNHCDGTAGGEVKGIWTAVGCVETDPTKMTATVMKVALSVAGGVTILVILAAGFLFSTSQGDPKRTSEAKEMMTSAVVGLLFIIFSVTILQFIGVNVLQIPGFGGP